MKTRKYYLLRIKTHIRNIITHLALHLAYYFWRYATKRNPNLGYTCLDGLHKLSFAEPQEEKENITKPLPEPKQA